MLKRDAIFPLLVRGVDLDATAEVLGLAVPLGHDLFALLVEIREGKHRPVRLPELNGPHLDGYGGHVVAIENLSGLARTQHFRAQLYRTRSEQQFILWQGCELTASCCQLPFLFKLSRKQLATDALCLCVPHRERLVLFSRGTSASRLEMRRLIEKHDGHGSFPLCLDFFSVQADGISPLEESDDVGE